MIEQKNGASDNFTAKSSFCTKCFHVKSGPLRDSSRRAGSYDCSSFFRHYAVGLPMTSCLCMRHLFPSKKQQSETSETLPAHKQDTMATQTATLKVWSLSYPAEPRLMLIASRFLTASIAPSTSNDTVPRLNANTYREAGRITCRTNSFS